MYEGSWPVMKATNSAPNGFGMRIQATIVEMRRSAKPAAPEKSSGRATVVSFSIRDSVRSLWREQLLCSRGHDLIEVTHDCILTSFGDLSSARMGANWRPLLLPRRWGSPPQSGHQIFSRSAYVLSSRRHETPKKIYCTMMSGSRGN